MEKNLAIFACFATFCRNKNGRKWNYMELRPLLSHLPQTRSADVSLMIASRPIEHGGTLHHAGPIETTPAMPTTPAPLAINCSALPW
jgi:hypothetical protein